MGQADTVERVFLQASPGLEGVLQREATPLGRARRVAGGVELEGPPGIHAEANLVLRVAERVLLRLAEAPARSWSEALEVLAGPPARSAPQARGSSRAQMESRGDTLLAAVAPPGAAVVLEPSVRLPDGPRSPAGVAEVLARAWGRPVSSARGTD